MLIFYNNRERNWKVCYSNYIKNIIKEYESWLIYDISERGILNDCLKVNYSRIVILFSKIFEIICVYI